MKYKLIILILNLLIFSCSSKKNVLYLQDLDDNNIKSFKYIDYIIKSDDVLKIDITALDSETVDRFNLNPNSFSGTSRELLIIHGYKVKNDGSIMVPIVGKVHMADFSIEEAENNLYEILLNRGFLVNHTVNISLVNAHVTVLGDVLRPGTYNYSENNMNILKAIGLAGDLNITGDRKNVKLIRDTNSVKTIHNIDLTKSEYLYSEYFQIFSGDIIIVNPNINKVKTAGVIGNSGTLLSLLSFILTSIIVIQN